jgi:peptidoglycan/xylan/chitin deacetylase (PgdA/CDA1 family)
LKRMSSRTWWRKLRPQEVPRAVILAYHRVAEPARDPNLLCVSPARFREHLAIIKRRWDPVRLADVSRLVRETQPARPSVVVTFDDGYRDNLQVAAPELAAAGIPATVFLATGYIGQEREFWWEELEGILFETPLRASVVRAEVGGKIREWALAANSAPEWEGGDWNVTLGANPTARQAAYLELARILKNSSDLGRIQILTQLGGEQHVVRSERTCMSEQEVRDLAGSGLVDVGAHTVTHPCLARLSPAEQRSEMEASRCVLEDLLGRPVRSFAYPYGGREDIGAETPRIAKEAGFDLACTNFRGFVSRVSDPFRLPRLVVRDWDGPTFERKIEALVGDM